MEDLTVENIFDQPPPIISDICPSLSITQPDNLYYNCNPPIATPAPMTEKIITSDDLQKQVADLTTLVQQLLKKQ